MYSDVELVYSQEWLVVWT